MIISEKEKIIFFHNPKAAGTSIVSSIIGKSDFAVVTNTSYSKKILDDPKYKRMSLNKILSMCETKPLDVEGLEQKLTEVKLCEGSISEFMAVNCIDFSTYFKFCFVRNPYNWRYSAWRQHMEAFTQFAHPDYPFAHRLHIKEQYLEFNNYPNILDIGLYEPQNLFTHINGEQKLDFIGKTESFDSDWKRLIILKPVLPSVANQRNTRSVSGGNYLKHYTSQTIEMVNDVYDKDFKLLGYDKLKPQLFPKSLSPQSYEPILPS